MGAQYIDMGDEEQPHAGNKPCRKVPFEVKPRKPKIIKTGATKKDAEFDKKVRTETSIKRREQGLRNLKRPDTGKKKRVVCRECKESYELNAQDVISWEGSRYVCDLCIKRIAGK